MLRHSDRNTHPTKETDVTAVEINTVVQHFVCRIFQQAAKDLGVSVIVIPPADAECLNQAAQQLEQVLTHFVQSSQATAH